MTTATAARIPGIDDLERQVRPLWEAREELEKQLSVLPQQNTLLDEKARSLKRKLAAGDKTASAQLDETDRERRENARREEGLRDQLADLDVRIQPLKQRIADLRRAATEAKNEAEFQEWCDDLDAKRELFLKHYTAACRTLGEIQVSGYEGSRHWVTGNKALRELERRIFALLANPLNDLHRQGWRAPEQAIYGREFFVRGMLPPADWKERNGHSNGKPKS